MSLWIRSQDKECLMKVNRVDINEDNVIIAEGFEIWLGAYKSRERALEVLNEIQNKLTDKYLMQPNCFISPYQLVEKKIAYEQLNNASFITTELGYDITPITVGTTVYEMPEE